SFIPPEFKGIDTFQGIGVLLLGTTGFAGISLTDEFKNFGGGAIPPDTTGAIVPMRFFEVINGGAAVYNRSTGARLSLVTMDTFFSIAGGVFPHQGSFDPRLLFDRRSGHWFAVA